MYTFYISFSQLVLLIAVFHLIRVIFDRLFLKRRKGMDIDPEWLMDKMRHR